MRKLGVSEIEDIALGAALLGAGGGGDPYVGKLVAIGAVKECGPCTGQQKLDTLIVFFYIQSAITVQTHMFPCTVLVLNIPVSMQAVPR